LFKCLVGGAISIIPIVFIELGLDMLNVWSSTGISSFYNAFVVAAFTVELLKFLVLFLLVWKSKEFDQYYDGIVYAVFVSLGMAVVENLLYVLQSSNGFEVAYHRAILSIPLHGFCGVIMGYFFSIAKFSKAPIRRDYLTFSLLVPILVHGLYDFILMYSASKGDDDFLSSLLNLCLFPLIILLWKVGLKNIKTLVIQDKIIISEQNEQ
jgi:RsiW-degrading membrane proteinase PrsW (M82 family)